MRGCVTAQSVTAPYVTAPLCNRSGGEARFSFARENFLGVKTLQAIASLKRQLLEALSMAGLAPPGLRASSVEEKGKRSGGARRDRSEASAFLPCPQSRRRRSTLEVEG